MPRVSLRLAWTAVLLLLIVGCEGFRNVSGRVVDPAGNPVPRAIVWMSEGGEGGPSEQVDSAGRFDLTFFASMLSYQVPLSVEAPGYHPYVRWVRIGRPTDLVLIPQSTPLEGPGWREPQTVPYVGAHYGAPLRWSATLGVSRGSYAGLDHFRGWVAAAEPGEGGAKVRLGYTRRWPVLGGELSAAALHTVGDPWSVAPDQTFVGGEARVYILAVALSLGGYTRVIGDAPGDERLVSFSVGLGR